MKKIVTLALLTSTFISEGCYTYKGYNGKRYVQLLPVKEQTSVAYIDSSKFIRQPFFFSDYNNKVGYKGAKKVVQDISGKDLQEIAATKNRYLFYLLNPNCRGSRGKMHQLDSIAQHEQNVIIVSMRNNFAAIDGVLGNTSFAAYLYYVIRNKRQSKILIKRIADFKKEACPGCYVQKGYAMSDYILIDNGKIMTFNSTAMFTNPKL